MKVKNLALLKVLRENGFYCLCTPNSKCPCNEMKEKQVCKCGVYE